MLAEMTSAQFAEWRAYAQLEPFGEERADMRAGIVASTIANANRGKGQKPFQVRQFMPDFEPPDEEAAIARMLERTKLALGGRR